MSERLSLHHRVRLDHFLRHTHRSITNLEIYNLFVVDMDGNQLRSRRRSQNNLDTVGTVPPSINPRFLRSNYVLSESEVSEMKSDLAQDIRQVRQYEQEKARHPSTWEGLNETALQIVEERIKQRGSVLSVKRRVPGEIWRSIFEEAKSHPWCLWLGDKGLGGIRMDYVQIFSCVCTRWRSIAHSCPGLWSSIFIHLYQSFPVRTRIHLIETFLSKSEGCPLTTFMSSDNWYSNDPGLLPSHAQRVWRTIAPQLARCENLILRLPNPVLLDAFQTLEVWFSNLVSFSTRAYDGPHTPKDMTFWQAIKVATKLTTVDLISGLIPAHLFPYAKLTSLTIQEFSVAETQTLLRVLQDCRSIRYLALGWHMVQTYLGQRSNGGYSSTGPVVVHTPSLRTLLIYDCVMNINDSWLHFFFASLKAPSLQSFALCSKLPPFSNMSSWPFALVDILHRSSPTLQRLSLSLCLPKRSIAQQRLSSLLRSTPHLTHLNLHMVGSQGERWYSSESSHTTAAPDFVCMFLSDLTSDPILPDLNHISLHVPHMNDLDGAVTDDFLSLATSRRSSNLSLSDGHVRPLTKLYLSRTVDVSDTEDPQLILSARVMEMIEDLASDGVDVVIDEFHFCGRSDPEIDFDSFTEEYS
ncbi:hypothetical protein L218DRAFT_1031913 [Marasmius fiardii PR-910]|nr:hypothetical protein L218DRAFT_1031913 [Marasmius fiardii PR-910]